MLRYEIKTNKRILSYVNLLHFVYNFLVLISYKIENLKPLKNFI